MEGDPFKFSFDMSAVDRQALLREAAEQLDQRPVPLGSGKPRGRSKTAEADTVRELLDERATLAAFPDVYKVTDKDFLDHQRPVAVRFTELAQKSNFYWIRFPVGLQPARGWAFNRLEARIEFNEAGAPHTRPKAYQILPNKQFQTLLDVSDHLEIGLDENFQLSAKSGAVEGQLGPAGGKLDASVDAKAAAGVRVVAGPFVYRLKRAKIDHNAAGMEWVFWRLDGAEFFQEDTPDLVVIAQVPKEIGKQVQVTAQLQAARYFNFATADLQQAITQLPRAVRNFFQGGLPIRDTKVYDLSAVL